MNWASVTRAEWISVAAATIACASAFFTWRNLRIAARKEKREIDATKPVIEHALKRITDNDSDFLRVQIVVRNRAAHSLVVDSIACPKPEAAALLKRNIPYPPYNATPSEYDAVARRNCAAEVKLDELVEPGITRTISVNLRVLRPSPTVQLIVSLSERLPDVRRANVTLTIDVPAEAIRKVKTIQFSAPKDSN